MGQSEVAAGLEQEQPLAHAQRSEAIANNDGDDEDDDDPKHMFKQYMCSTKYLTVAMLHDACSGLDRFKQGHHQLRSDT